MKARKSCHCPASCWLITVPAAAILSIIFFLIGRYFFLDTLIEIVLTARQ